MRMGSMSQLGVGWGVDDNHGYMVSWGNKVMRTSWGDPRGSPGSKSSQSTFSPIQKNSNLTKLRYQGGLQLPVCTAIALHVPWEL